MAIRLGPDGDAAPRERAADPRIAEVAGALRRELRGEARADGYSRHLFAADASMYAIEPLVVAFPRDADDVAAAISVAGRFDVPVITRGAGNPGAQVVELDAGCCGMAGSFGFESEHYDLSMRIGELRLFPALRGEGAETLIAATGVSCRQQIAHRAGRQARHPVQLVREGLTAPAAAG